MAVKIIRATFGDIWAIFYSSIWSHWLRVQTSKWIQKVNQLLKGWYKCSTLLGRYAQMEKSLNDSFFFKKNGSNLASFCLFWVFSIKHYTINVKKCPSRIGCQDLNSQTFNYESPPWVWVYLDHYNHQSMTIQIPMI